MVDLANERGGADNLTAVVAHVKGNGPPEPNPTETIAETLEIVRSFSGPR